MPQPVHAAASLSLIWGIVDHLPGHRGQTDEHRPLQALGRGQLHQRKGRLQRRAHVQHRLLLMGVPVWTRSPTRGSTTSGGRLDPAGLLLSKRDQAAATLPACGMTKTGWPRSNTLSADAEAPRYRPSSVPWLIPLSRACNRTSPGRGARDGCSAKRTPARTVQHQRTRRGAHSSIEPALEHHRSSSILAWAGGLGAW
jgi:hypothetical protein